MNTTTEFRRRQILPLKIGLFICLWILSSAGCTNNQEGANTDLPDPFEITEGWEYTWGDPPFDSEDRPVWTYGEHKDIEWNPVAYDDGIRNPPGRNGQKILWLRLALPDILLLDPHIWIQQIAFAGEVYIEKDIIYKFKSVGIPGQGRITELRSHRFPILSDFQNKTLYLRIYSEDPTQIGFSFIKLGSQRAFGKLLIKEIYSITIFGFLFIAAGLFPLLLFVFRRKEKLYLVFGFLCITMGFWILGSTETGQQLIAGNRILFFITSIIPFLSAASLCAYFEQIYGAGYKSILRRLWQIFLLYTVVVLVFLIVSFTWNQFMIVMLSFFAVFASSIVFIFILSIKKALEGNKEAIISSIGISTLAFFGLYDILGGIFKLFPWSHNTYQWGLFLFIVSLGIVLEHRFRQNAVALEKSHKKLQEYSQTLELKVKERTQDLEEKNLELAETLKELKDTQEQLIMQEKMASLGNLVAGVAHEINTPAGAVKSSADVLSRSLNKIKAKLQPGQKLEEILTSADYKKSFQALEDNTHITFEASERIANIVKSLKSFARLDEAEYQKADIHEGLESTLTLINYEMKGRVSIHKDYGDIPKINCFPNQLNQVFMNLLMNALAAIEKDGIIGIKTFVEGRYLVVQISDNGHGIPKDIQERIFDPGFTTRSQGVGTGLGLSISYKIIHKHQGEIKVDSELGKGSTFSIYLPTDLKAQ